MKDHITKQIELSKRILASQELSDNDIIYVLRQYLSGYLKRKQVLKALRLGSLDSISDDLACYNRENDK